jgi:hypothetical protein
LPEAAVKAFHEGYGWRPNAEELSRLWLMRAALHLVAGSWTYTEIAGGNRAPGLTELLERHVSGMGRMLDDPALAAHLVRAR